MFEKMNFHFSITHLILHTCPRHTKSRSLIISLDAFRLEMQLRIAMQYHVSMSTSTRSLIWEFLGRDFSLLLMFERLRDYITYFPIVQLQMPTQNCIEAK